MALKRFQMTGVLGDFVDVPKPHFNLENFGLPPGNELPLAEVHKYMYSGMDGRF